ncbi:hypothetical protein RQP46_007963 [Phenoliferia psychrophenolica]
MHFLAFLPVALVISSALVGAAPGGRGLDERAAGSASVHTTCTKSGTFAMSFDDGPYIWGGDVATFFEQHGSLASFFVNGHNWDCIYDRADDLLARYNAAWGHDDITTLSASEFAEQLDLVETALLKILGVKPRFFLVTWDVDSGDSTGLTPSQSINVYSKLYSQYPKPHMALNHETYHGTVYEVIQNVVPKLLSAGYQLVTIADCLGVDPYQSVSSPGKRDSTWTCDGKPKPGAPDRS